MNAPAKKIQILLVEDALDEIYLVRAMLEQGGPFQVTTTQDGEAASRMIEKKKFDLIITDLNLPGKDGYVLIREIKAAHPKLPILATTGYTANHYLEYAYRAGANHVMVKPLERKELLARVSELAGVKTTPATPPSAVLAIGALPGDVEGGCGGTLLGYRERGEGVLVLPLSTSTEDGGSGAEAERKAAELMGARIIISEAGNPSEHQLLLERLVREIKPHTVLIPSLADDNPERREAHRISRASLTTVKSVLAYETATSTSDFRPSRFVDIAPTILRKLEILGPFRAHGRPDLDPRYVQAAAVHWGRRAGFGEVEAFEVLRDEGKDLA
jgi:CheY-like chemotaxis protein